MLKIRQCGKHFGLPYLKLPSFAGLTVIRNAKVAIQSQRLRLIIVSSSTYIELYSSVFASIIIDFTACVFVLYLRLFVLLFITLH